MNLEKSEVKLSLARGWADKLDALASTAKNELQRLQGAAAVLKEAAKKTDGSHKGFYQRQLDGGEINTDECRAAIRVVDRCVNGLIAMQDTVSTSQLIKRGEINAIQRVRDMLRAEHDRERALLTATLEALERGEIDPDGRPVGALRVVDGNGRRIRAVEELRQRRAAAAVEEPAPAIEALEEPAAAVEALEEPAPAVEEPAPAVEEPAPAIEEPAPAVEEPAPAVEGSVEVEASTAAVEGSVEVEASTAAVEELLEVEVPTVAVEEPLEVENPTVAVEEPLEVEVPTVAVEEPLEVEVPTVAVEALEEPAAEDVARALATVEATAAELAGTKKVVTRKPRRPVRRKTAPASTEPVAAEALLTPPAAESTAENSVAGGASLREKLERIRQRRKRSAG